MKRAVRRNYLGLGRYKNKNKRKRRIIEMSINNEENLNKSKKRKSNNGDNNKINISDLFEPTEEEIDKEKMEVIMGEEYLKQLDKEDGGWEGDITKNGS